MSTDLPLVSIIMATYNRAHTIERAIDSVLKQRYQPIELIIVDDGSTDNTSEVLKKYTSPAIRIHQFEKNKGVTAAKNVGLNAIKGEWFTILDSDDEITEDAIETMMNIPLRQDKTVTAVTCNCLDTSTNSFSGTGLLKDQYLSMDDLMKVCKGEFWGITKTSLLQDNRFNEKLRGFESTLWYRINDRAKRYYCHKALRIYHTEGDDRIMKTTYNFQKDVLLYENLIEENHFLEMLRKYQPDDFNYLCKTGLVIMRVANKKEIADRYYTLLKSINNGLSVRLSNKYKFFSQLLQQYWVYKKKVKSSLSLQ